MQAVGDVAAHPLAGIEAVTWSPTVAQRYANGDRGARLSAAGIRRARHPAFMALITSAPMPSATTLPLQAMAPLAGHLTQA